MAKELMLFAFDMNCAGHQSVGLWRHPRDKSSDYTSAEYWKSLAQTLERGKFDGIFLADVSGLYDVYGGSPETALRAGVQVPANDPFTLVPVIAGATENLCIGVTGAIPYRPPYGFARLASSLDHLSDGRFGWNIVTGYLDSEARGHGKSKKEKHDTRYDVAHEYMEVVYRLWEGSWEEGSVLRDRDAGIYTDPSKVHSISFNGEYYNLEAVHICEPSPQRTPLLFQAGASTKGRAFAGRHAECVFVGGHSPEAMGETVQTLREECVLQGRKSDDIKILGLITVVVAATDQEAQAKFEEYRSYGLPEGALALLSGWTGMDLSKLDLDAGVEEVESDAIQSIIKQHGARTVREWAQDLTVGGAGEVIIGSPETIADKLEHWADVSGVDGFNLAYTVLPECVEDFVDMVVPVLQARGRFKREYRPGTFREKVFGKTSLLADPHPGAEFRR